MPPTSMTIPYFLLIAYCLLLIAYRLFFAAPRPATHIAKLSLSSVLCIEPKKSENSDLRMSA